MIANEMAIPLDRLAATVARAKSHLSNVGNIDEHWLWDSTTQKGYGILQVRIDGRNRGVKVHRLMYLVYRGPIPEGLQLDHECLVKNCANPLHLAPVTNLVNSHRHWRDNRPICKNGHPVDEINTHVRPNGRRYCKTCQNDLRRSRYVPLAERMECQP